MLPFLVVSYFASCSSSTLCFSLSLLILFHHFVAGMPKYIKEAKIACLDFNFQKAKMALGVQVLVDDPEKLDGIRQR